MATHTQPTNAEIARLRELGRRRRSRAEAGRFLVEGPKLVVEALRSRLAVVDIVAADGWQIDDAIIGLAADANVLVRVGGARSIDRISTTSSPQPIIAEVALPDTSWQQLAAKDGPPGPPALMVGVDVNDPGNLGTMTRSAAAAGFSAVVALGDCADPFGPKAVRSSAGLVFDMPFIIDRSVTSGLEHIANLGVRRVGTRMNEATACDVATLDGPIALIVGNEAHGLSADIESAIDEWVRVPMPGNVESLNVAMAATILSYEVARQRRATSIDGQANA